VMRQILQCDANDENANSWCRRPHVFNRNVTNGCCVLSHKLYSCTYNHDYTCMFRPLNDHHPVGIYIELYVKNVNSAMLSGSLVTTAWRVLKLRMEKTASTYGG
jgi:hypothetical protein